MEGLPGSGGGGGKLRLKRKRPPPEASAGSGGFPLRGRLQIEGCGSCWLEEPSLREADSTWLALLKAADPQLNRSSSEKMAKLPEFLKESSQITNPQPKPETFNIGLEQFPWEPFPLYHREVKMIDHGINRNLDSPTIRVAEQEINDEKSCTISPVPDQKPLITKEYTTEESRTRPSTGHSSKDCRKKIKNPQHSHSQNSPTYSAAAPEHCSSKKLSLQKLWGKTATQNRKKSMRESEKERAPSGNTLTQNNLLNSTTSLLPSQGSPVNSSVRGLPQKPGCPNEDISTLDCCPMCQIHFSRELSQLDRDSHLAKCLSESTEDVIW